MTDFQDIKSRISKGGFTLLELLVVVVILGIAALVAVPAFSGAADMQVRAAANRIAADLDYAKGLAVTHQKDYSVVFDTANEAYQIEDNTGTPVDNPVRPGSQYVVSLKTDSNFSRVNIATAAFNTVANHSVTFDYLGSPYDTNRDPLNTGRVTLQADTFTLYVDVEPMTGYVTITSP